MIFLCSVSSICAKQHQKHANDYRGNLCPTGITSTQSEENLNVSIFSGVQEAILGIWLWRNKKKKKRHFQV